LQLDITPIIKNNGGTIRISEEIYLEDMGTKLGTINFTDPVYFSGSVTNFNGMLVLEGIAKTKYETVCDRCGERIEKEFSIKIYEDIVQKSEKEVEETYLSEDDRFAFSGHMLELGRILADCMITNLPMSQLCSENCAGLCSVCGAPVGSCNCNREKPVDPRFDVLKGFFE